MSAAVKLDDKYTRAGGRILLSGIQALVRLPLEQRARDAAAGLNTAGYISGYRGSPLGGYDQQLERERARLEAAGIRFAPGVNEDLAATAAWGTQQVTLLPAPKVDGVFAIWYGKGPGVDRSGDPIKHGNRMGSSRHGGVLLVFGDDHAGKSSTVSHQSEQAMAASGVPVLYPATVQEYLEFGLHAFALSRYAGTWAAFKCVNETVETTASVDLDALRIVPVEPAGELPPGGVHARFGFDPIGDEVRLVRHKLPRARAYVRANGLDRVTHGAARDDGRRGLGLVAAGKSWLDAAQALTLLGLDVPRLAALGVALYKPALIWPLDAEGLVAFARGRGELLVIEEKAPFLEPQVAHALFNLPDGARPVLGGKSDPSGAPQLPADVALDAAEVARAIGTRLVARGLADAALRARLAEIDAAHAQSAGRAASGVTRAPYFCAGCPHNSSTRLPDGSIAFAGIGCHTMALSMNRHTLPPTQMGGEGMSWAGIAPFSDIAHVFQNIGDGTYFHSGLLAVRAAVAADVNITYKLLYNDAVAMTGGQPVEGRLTVAEITRQLRAERVARIAVVSDEPAKYGRHPGFAAGTTLHHRAELEVLQRELRTVRGVSALIYDQTCAAEKRRRRKRGRYPDPARRLVINAAVCEGCGDCSVQSNCVAVEPLETEFGRKRRIDQSSCNKDYACGDGFCPAFVAVEGGALRRGAVAAGLDAALGAALPEPLPAAAQPGCAVLVAGIGGSGVVTVGAVLAMAAHIDGLVASVFDMTGLAQKGGGVLSHVRLGAPGAPVVAPRIGALEADVVLGCDLVVAVAAEVLRALAPGRTRVVVNSQVVPTAAFQLDPDVDFRGGALAAVLAGSAGTVDSVDATRAALALLGDTQAGNVLMVGYALQKGWLPVSARALEQALELNGVAVALNRRALALGRLAAHDPARLAALLEAAQPAPAPPPASLAERVEVRAAFLADYQDERYAARLRALVARVAAAEERVRPGSTLLAETVARNHSKLLAYKDEYEVARLHCAAAFRRELEATFEGPYRVRYLLAPPLLARRDPHSGVPRKMEFGGWIVPLLAVLARLRRLRGTWLDPFGYGAERRRDRQLIADYESLVAELVAGLRIDNHELAVELAGLPAGIRGFGHVRTRQLAEVRRREQALRERWQAARAA